MTTVPSQSSQDSDLERTLAALRAQTGSSARSRVIHGRLVLEGSVPSYDWKSRIEDEARAYGLPVDNHLRVVPATPDFKIMAADFTQRPLSTRN